MLLPTENAIRKKERKKGEKAFLYAINASLLILHHFSFSAMSAMCQYKLILSPHVYITQKR
jgi:hypothetical protein